MTTPLATPATSDSSTLYFGPWYRRSPFFEKTLEAGWITDRQIEAARIAMTRHIKRGGKIWIRMFPDKPITKKPAETRMGSGKGAPDHWVAVVNPGRVLYEIQGVDEALAREAMKLAAQKLPIKTKFVSRADLEGGVV